MGNESCCAPTKNQLRLTDQALPGKSNRAKRDPFANLEGYIPDEEADREIDTYKNNSRNSSSEPDKDSNRKMGTPGKPLLYDISDGEASYVSKEERVAAQSKVIFHKDTPE